MGLGIYWVFFDSHGGHEMKIRVDAVDNESAKKHATILAKTMDFGWKFREVQVCR